MQSLKDYIFEAKKHDIIELSELQDETSKMIMDVLEVLVSKGYKVYETKEFTNGRWLYYCVLVKNSDYVLIVGGNDLSRINKNDKNFTVYCSNKKCLVANVNQKWPKHDDKIIKLSQSKEVNKRTLVNYNEYQYDLLNRHDVELPKSVWYTVCKHYTSSMDDWDNKAKYYNVIMHNSERNIDKLPEKVKERVI